ncbi:MAG: isoaspartyl peptidase/L-asparaginase [Planctomycetota bacterium]
MNPYGSVVVRIVIVAVALSTLVGCGVVGNRLSGARAGHYAIAIHGGAGVIDRDAPGAEVRRDALRRALARGVAVLRDGGTSLDAVQQVVELLENDPHFNAGVGAVFTSAGDHELDASIMDGETLACGAVAGIRTVRNPILLARHVMDESRHVMFASIGAEEYARVAGFDVIDPHELDVEHRRKQWQRAQERERAKQRDDTRERGTVGAVALDQRGNLAAATSTGGLTNKRFGRVGDSPVIGAGTYANNRSCAVSCTGTGEEFIRHTVARDIAALVEYRGLSAQAAAEEVVLRKLAPGDGGVIVVSRTGEIALVFNTTGMYRGAADASGRFDVSIWDDGE